MKAAYIEETGPPEVVQFGDLPKPKPGPRQVLVKTQAVSLNPIDTYIRNGANFWELPKPFVVGCDIAGVVEELGEGTSRYQVGDRVWATNQGLLGKQGTFAEYCVIDEQWLYPTPDAVDDVSAAACALVGITAHLGLFRDAQLKPGETLWVNGGSGSVGAMVLQMAKAVGARAVTTAGTDEKVAKCVELGANMAVNYNTEDVDQAIRSFAPNGCDVIWETRREPNFDSLVENLAERGRIILMAGRDARPPFPVGPFYVKCAKLFGFVMFKASAEEMEASALAINEWLSDGTLKAHIGREMKLSEAADAHRLQEDNTLHQAGTLAGKIVLTP